MLSRKRSSARHHLYAAIVSPVPAAPFSTSAALGTATAATSARPSTVVAAASSAADTLYASGAAAEQPAPK